MSSIQVLPRLRAALTGLAESTTIAARAEAVRRYLKHLDLVIERSSLDSEDKVKALQEDPQGLTGTASTLMTSLCFPNATTTSHVRATW